MPIVHVCPSGQGVLALLGYCVSSGVGTLTQSCLYKALGLAVGLRCVGFGADMLQAELFARVAEREGFVTGSIVGHDALDLDAQLCIPGHRRLQMRDGAGGLLVRMDLGEGGAGRIVDADMDMLPSGAASWTPAKTYRSRFRCDSLR